MRSILVTAFEPFGSRDYNPSAEVLARLKDRAGLHRLLLPVSYDRAASGLHKAIRKLSPDFVVLTGLASGRDAVCLEACALNVKAAAIPDNDGLKADGERLVEKVLLDIEERHFALKTLFDRAFPIDFRVFVSSQ